MTFTTAKALEAVEKTLAAHSPSVRIVIPDKQDVVKDVRVELPDAALKAVQEAGLNLKSIRITESLPFRMPRLTD